MQFKLATVMLIAGALAAPAEVERRGDRKDQWTQDGMNCWGRNDPGNAGMMEVAIHISGIEMNAYSPGKMQDQLGKNDCMASGWHEFHDPATGEVKIRFLTMGSCKSKGLSKAFGNSAGKVDPGCHTYGGSAPVTVNGAMDSISASFGIK